MTREVMLGTRVEASDGHAGSVAKIITNPKTQELDYLVIKVGRIRSRDVLVPVAVVEEASASAVRLGVSRQVLETFPDYESVSQKGSYSKPLVVGTGPATRCCFQPKGGDLSLIRRHNVPDHSLALSRGLAVHDRRGANVGRLEGVVADEDTRQARFLLARPALLRSPARAVPAELVEHATEETVTLRIDREHLRGLWTAEEV